MASEVLLWWKSTNYLIQKFQHIFIRNQFGTLFKIWNINRGDGKFLEEMENLKEKRFQKLFEFKQKKIICALSNNNFKIKYLFWIHSEILFRKFSFMFLVSSSLIFQCLAVTLDCKYKMITNVHDNDAPMVKMLCRDNKYKMGFLKRCHRSVKHSQTKKTRKDVIMMIIFIERESKAKAIQLLFQIFQRRSAGLP